MTEIGSLEAWIWSYGAGDTKSFLYRRGASSETAVSGGATRVERVVNEAGGWGSYFTANTARSYELRLEIVSSTAPPRPARLLLKSIDE